MWESKVGRSCCPRAERPRAPPMSLVPGAETLNEQSPPVPSPELQSWREKAGLPSSGAGRETSQSLAKVLGRLWSVWFPAVTLRSLAGEERSGGTRRLTPPPAPHTHTPPPPRPSPVWRLHPVAERWERRIWQGAPPEQGACKRGKGRSPALNVRKSPGQLGLCKVCFGKSCST